MFVICLVYPKTDPGEHDITIPVRHWASLVVQLVKNLPAKAGDTRDMGWEDPLEKEMATHSSIFAWKIPWTEEPGRLDSIGPRRVGHN